MSTNPRIAEKKITDPRGFGRVGLVIGGDSHEREVSLDGGRAVSAALKHNGIDYQIYDGAKALFTGIAQGQVDRVFNLLHGPGGEDGALQGALRLMNIPVTGSDVLGSALSMDKVRSKWVWQQRGIPTPPFILLERDKDDFDTVLQHFELPLFVKPTGQGSSIGISKVTIEQELAPAVALARQYGEQVLIEPGVDGDEYFVGIINGTALPLIRIQTPNAFYDYEAKYESDSTQYFCPCGLDADVEQRLQAMALKAFDALGTSGWGRVDLLLDHEQQPWFLEVNTTPGMTDHSLVPQAAAEIGIGFDELVWRILETSL